MIRIALDLDDTIFDFLGAYREAFPGERNMEEPKITKNVLSLKRDKKFWENLPLLEMPNFDIFSIYSSPSGMPFANMPTSIRLVL